MRAIVAFLLSGLLVAGFSARAEEPDSVLDALAKAAKSAVAARASWYGVAADSNASVALRTSALKRFLDALALDNTSGCCTECERILTESQFPDYLLDLSVAEWIRLKRHDGAGVVLLCGELRNALKSPSAAVVAAIQRTQNSLVTMTSEILNPIIVAPTPEELVDPFKSMSKGKENVSARTSIIAGANDAEVEDPFAPNRKNAPKNTFRPEDGLQLKERGVQLATNLLIETRGSIEKHDWQTAKTRLTEWFRMFPEHSPVEAFNVTLKLVIGEAGEKSLSSVTADRFLTFITQVLTDADHIEQAEYFICESFYKEGVYDQARARLVAFQKEHPSTQRLGQCRLLEGNTYVLLGENDKGLGIFKNLAEDTKSDPATAERALFLTGWTYLFSQDMTSAKKYFDMLQTRFPNSEHARKAREILSRQR